MYLEIKLISRIPDHLISQLLRAGRVTRLVLMLKWNFFLFMKRLFVAHCFYGRSSWQSK